MARALTLPQITVFLRSNKLLRGIWRQQTARALNLAQTMAFLRSNKLLT